MSQANVRSVIVGVDVGGTNTDTVLMEANSVISYSKSPTTSDVTSGLYESLKTAITKVKNVTLKIVQINIGTTHFVNAVLQRKHLVPVAVIRLCGTCSNGIPPFSDIPQHLKSIIEGPVFMIEGGFQFDGREIVPLQMDKVRNCLNFIKNKGINHLVISSVFSPVCNQHEEAVSTLIKSEFPTISYTLSNRIGQMGLLHRENAGILNESLKPLCQTTIKSLLETLKLLNLDCPLYFTQNDGTIISIEQTLKFPVHTFASGPTNSMRGAAFLTGIKNAVVADIGGTTCDVGAIIKGFPREASTYVEIGGVRTNFHMPDMQSIGLGGGSLVQEKNGHITVGPLSVGSELITKAIIFNGSFLTATDIAVANNLISIGNPELVSNLSSDLIESAIFEIRRKIEKCVECIKLSSEKCPLILVGGGSVLISQTINLKGISQIVQPLHFDIANAIGAALSQVSGVIDRVVSLKETSRLEALGKVKEDAVNEAIIAGASLDSVEIIEVNEIPLAYLPGTAVRMKVKAVGNLNENNQIKFDSNILNLDIETNTEALVDAGVDPVFDEIASTTPYVNPKTGEWELTPWDIECIAVGTAVLGCGGGGNSYLGKIRALKKLKEGKKIRVITPTKFEQIYNSKELVFGVAGMGAPVIGMEKLSTENLEIEVLKCMLEVKQYLADSSAESKCPEIKKDSGIVYIDDFKSNHTLSVNLTDIKAVISEEIGGANGIKPFIIAADLNIPVIDADRMGRAFPELQMDLPNIYGEKCYPACLLDDKGRRAVILQADSPKHVENYLRNVVIEMGCAGVFSFPPLTIKTIKKTCALHTVSRAWRLGNAILQAPKLNLSPSDAILNIEDGKLLIKGKITDIQHSIEKGFSRGTVAIDGFDNFLDHHLCIHFQNENLIAIDISSTEILACTPDLITIIDSDSGIPIQTEEVRYGLRVNVLAISCSPALRSSEALVVVGPQAFGYSSEIQFKPIAEFKDCLSIATL